LKVLNLSGDTITDEDMARIARFKNLEVLALADTEITGSGIKELEGMARLNELNISNCAIQDYDLSTFLSMPNLRIVYAEGCNISEFAIRNIIAQFPTLAIFP
jgi:Leucine-rich repeat (LRR) protein